MEKSFNEKVADNIKKYRKDADITLKELALKVGITEATMQKYEAGNIKTVGTEMVIKIANALGVEPSKILGWEENKKNIGAEILKKYNLLTNEHQKVVNDLIDSLLKTQSIC